MPNSLHQAACALLLIILIISACNNNSETNATPVKTSNRFDCSNLTNKKFIDSIAHAILEKKDNDLIWNLSDIDTSELFTTEDYFTNTKTKNRLVLVAGEAGMSAGTANHLLLLFACNDTPTVIWAGQSGEFSSSGIQDINHDGIKEIVCNTSTMWMGECDDNYEIFNFENGRKHSLYSTHSISMIDCGRDSLGNLFKTGDTLETKYDCLLRKAPDTHFEIQQIKSIKIHNGGKTDDEIISNLHTITDTIIVKL